MAKKLYLAMTPFELIINLFGADRKIQLPDGCSHVMSVWKTKKAAKEWFGDKNIPFLEIEKHSRNGDGEET